MADLGWPELSIIVITFVLLFGWKKMPDIARSLGRSARIFKSEVDEMRTDATPATSPTTSATPTTPTTPAADARVAAAEAEVRAALADAEVLRLRSDLG